MAPPPQYPYPQPTDPGNLYENYDQRNWLNYGSGKYFDYNKWLQQSGQGPTLSGLLTSAGYRGMEGLLNYGGLGSAMGYSNLMNILASQGKTDPRAMQGMQRGITRDTRGNEQAIRDQLAGRGLQNSGVGMALQAANQGAGADAQQNLRANEAQLQEQRKRDDLSTLFQQLILQPSTDASAMALGQYNADRSNSQGSKDQKNAMYGQILMGLLGAMCHATAALFGDCSDEVDGVRVYMASEASPRLAAAYGRQSKALAYAIERSPMLRKQIEPAFVRMAQRGYLLIGG